MKLYPNIYLKNVKEITLELLKQNDIKGLILDVDNTLIDFNDKTIDGIEIWANEMKKNNIKMCILSNNKKVKKVKKVAKELDLKYISFAKKPFKSGFKKASKLLELNNKNIAVVGDQIMTDVYGGNRMNMFTILTKPLDKRDFLITRIKRPLENIIIKRYLKSIKTKEQEKKDVF